MKKSNYSVFFRDVRQNGVEYAVAHTVDMGYDGVEIFDVCRPSRWISDRSKMLELKALLQKNKLPVSCFSVALDLLSEDIDEVMASAIKHVEYTAELGSPYFHHTLIPNLKFEKLKYSFDEAFMRVIDNAEKIAGRCNELGIVCLYEPQGAYFNGVENLERLLLEVRGRGYNVGICGDLGNSLFADCQPIEVFRYFFNEIKHIHVKDFTVSETPAEGAYVSLGGKYIVDATVGQGNADIKSCLGCLKGYDGFYSFEVKEPDGEMKKAFDTVERIVYQKQ